MRVGDAEWVGWGKVVAGKRRQLYLNNNKKIKIKPKKQKKNSTILVYHTKSIMGKL